MRIPRMMLALAAIFVALPINAYAQSLRIADAAAIANGVSPPTVLESAFAPYSDEARSHRIEGTVTIQAVINDYGQIKDATILRGLGFGLDDLAIASAQEWLISPATLAGVPVSVVVQIDVPFSLRARLRYGRGAETTGRESLHRKPYRKLSRCIRRKPAAPGWKAWSFSKQS